MALTFPASPYKESHTDTHVFFLTGPLSNWHPSLFRAALPSFVSSHKNQEFLFCCTEQYMMASKAALFGDAPSVDAILSAMPDLPLDDPLAFEAAALADMRSWNRTPRAHKALGRDIKGFVPAIWDVYARPIVHTGALAKFGQNPHLGAYLHARKNKTLVEGADYDAVWGVKLAWNDPRIEDPQNWQGTNWLGSTLNAVADEMFAAG